MVLLSVAMATTAVVTVVCMCTRYIPISYIGYHSCTHQTVRRNSLMKLKLDYIQIAFVTHQLSSLSHCPQEEKPQEGTSVHCCRHALFSVCTAHIMYACMCVCVCDVTNMADSNSPVARRSLRR